MRDASRRAEQVDSPEFFNILRQSLQAAQKHAPEGSETRWKELLAAWASMNMLAASGEEINLKFDTSGKKQQIHNSLIYIELNGLTLGRIELSTYCLEVFIFAVQTVPPAFK